MEPAHNLHWPRLVLRHLTMKKLISSVRQTVELQRRKPPKINKLQISFLSVWQTIGLWGGRGPGQLYKVPGQSIRATNQQFVLQTQAVIVSIKKHNFSILMPKNIFINSSSTCWNLSLCINWISIVDIMSFNSTNVQWSRSEMCHV